MNPKSVVSSISLLGRRIQASHSMIGGKATPPFSRLPRVRILPMQEFSSMLVSHRNGAPLCYYGKPFAASFTVAGPGIREVPARTVYLAWCDPFANS